MNVSPSNVNPITQELLSEITALERENFLKRLWDKDPTLWSRDSEVGVKIKNRLGWLGSLDAMAEHVQSLEVFAGQLVEDGFQYAVLLGMGGSSLAPEVLQSIFGNRPGFPELIVLDSTDPRRIRDVEKKVSGKETLYIVASKSGTTIESASLYRYFYEKVHKKKGEETGNYFAAITDPGTALVLIAGEKKFRRIFLNPSNIGGRFSALTLFGLVPAAIVGADIGQLIQRAQAEAQDLQNQVSLKESQTVLLGASLAHFAKKGRDKLTLVTSGRWEAFGDWVEQLVAESLGKNGQGVLPVVRETWEAQETLGKDRFFAAFSTQKDASPEYQDKIKRLRESQAPLLEWSLKDDLDLGLEFFRWEVATAIAGSLLDLNPFDEPNVTEAKDATKRILQDMKPGESLRPPTEPLLGDEVRGKASQAIPESQGSLEASFQEFWKMRQENDYVAILAFLPERIKIRKHLTALQNTIRQKTGLPVTVGVGPRYLHSTGQLHKGGPNRGLYLVLTAPLEEKNDLAIPNAPYSFHELELAQARGDFEALDVKKRRAFYLELQDTSDKVFRNLINFVLKTLT